MIGYIITLLCILGIAIAQLLYFACHYVSLSSTNLLWTVPLAFHPGLALGLGGAALGYSLFLFVDRENRIIGIVKTSLLLFIWPLVIAFNYDTIVTGFQNLALVPYYTWRLELLQPETRGIPMTLKVDLGGALLHHPAPTRSPAPIPNMSAYSIFLVETGYRYKMQLNNDTLLQFTDLSSGSVFEATTAMILKELEKGILIPPDRVLKASSLYISPPRLSGLHVDPIQRLIFKYELERTKIEAKLTISDSLYEKREVVWAEGRFSFAPINHQSGLLDIF